jgi:hypothetical protein
LNKDQLEIQIENLRNILNHTAAAADSLLDDNVLQASQQLDSLIVAYYRLNRQNAHRKALISLDDSA